MCRARNGMIWIRQRMRVICGAPEAVGSSMGVVVFKLLRMTLGRSTLQRNSRKGAFFKILPTVGTWFCYLQQRGGELSITPDLLASTSVTSSGDFGPFSWMG